MLSIFFFLSLSLSLSLYSPPQGPITAEAIFLNREEVPVSPLYYDPVHDFGFLRFDPAALQFMGLGSVPLAPTAVAVGLEVRVVGNDSGEKVSILAGTIARIDRDAPAYGRRGYNDFNTFYLQAASGTKGGSSGSPVIDSGGQAVGLNAGGKHKAASAYYLPLDRVLVALHALQAAHDGAPGGPGWAGAATGRASVPRGDLGATFGFKGFDEARRLGLTRTAEAALRALPPQGGEPPGPGGGGGTGALVVESVIPGGPGDGCLEPGDILLAVNGVPTAHFLPLEAALDAAAAGGPGAGRVTLDLERGGAHRSLALAVQDLHAVTPDSFLEVGGGVVHALSYQQARNNRAAVGGVFVAEPGYMLSRAGVPKAAIITAFNHTPTPDLAAFAAALLGVGGDGKEGAGAAGGGASASPPLPTTARVPLSFLTFDDRHRARPAVADVDPTWYGPPLLWTRDDGAGVWGVEPASVGGVTAATKGQGGGEGRGAPSPTVAATAPPPPPPPPPPPEPPAAPPPALEPSAAQEGAQGSRAVVAAAAPVDARLYDSTLRSALALIEVDIPLVALVDGVHSRTFAGNALVVRHPRLVGVGDGSGDPGETFYSPDDASPAATTGLVLVDRNTAAVGPCDARLSFGASPAEARAVPLFLHPLHNFAVMAYDASALPPAARAAIRAAPCDAATPITTGEALELAGLTKDGRIARRAARVVNPGASLALSPADVPRFRAVHEEVVRLDHDFGSTFCGVLAHPVSGAVRALWASYAEQVDREEREFCAGLPAAVWAPWVAAVGAAALAGPGRSLGAGGAPPPITLAVPTLDAELEPLPLARAAVYGLPPAWVAALAAANDDRRTALRVRSTVAGSGAAACLRPGDLVLAVGGRVVTTFADVEAAVTAAGCGKGGGGGGGAPDPLSPDPPSSKRARGDAPASSAPPTPAIIPTPSTPTPTISMTVCRAGALSVVSIPCGLEDGRGTTRIAHWCGAQLQAPHRAVRELGYDAAALLGGGGMDGTPSKQGGGGGGGAAGAAPPAPAPGVYVSRWHHGSPAHRYGLFALHWVTHIGGQPTPDMASFLDAVSSIPDGAAVRVRLVHLETTKPKVLTLKQDLRHWPTWELVHEPQAPTPGLASVAGRWVRRVIKAVPGGAGWVEMEK